MMIALAGKTVVITGGGAGLGREIALQLSQAGARVAVLGRTLASLEETARQAGGDVLPLVADVGDPAQVAAAFLEVEQRFGGLDILVNNAAVYRAFALAEASDDELQQTLTTNVLGPLYCMRAVLPLMRSRGGDIVNVSSESVLDPFPMLSCYAGSKSALEVISSGLRSELAADDIRIMVFRTGRMDGDNANLAAWPEGRLQQFMAAATASGHMARVGAGMSPQSSAQAITLMLSLPRDACVHQLDLCSTLQEVRS